MDFKVLGSRGASLKIRNSLVGAVSLNQQARLFDFGNVIVQKDYMDNECVRIISGGPYYVGDYVGKGMLTAAIQGDNFTAPASSVILRTLRELSYNHLMGCLVIVPASSGCTLNFGLAIERAVNDEIVVKMLTVSDDFYNAHLKKTSQRTLSAIVLLYKIAGAMAESKKSLVDIYEYCSKICQRLYSMEVNLPQPNVTPNSTCICVDGAFSRVDPLHLYKENSVGTIKVPIAEMITILDEASNFLVDHQSFVDNTKLSMSSGDQLVILLNNNDIVTKTEEYGCVKDILEYLVALNINVMRFYAGNFIKCTETPMLTLTLMKVEDTNELIYLDSNYGNVPGWPSLNQYSGSPLTTEIVITGNLRRKDRLVAPIKGPCLSTRATNTLYFAIQFACDALISCETQLNIIDSERDDGDTGTRMKTVAQLLIKRMRQNKVLLNYPYSFFESMGHFLEKSLGGTSGCIYSILFEAAAIKFGEFKDNSEVTPEMWLESFKAAGESLRKYGNTTYGEGTLYDPIYIFCETAKVELDSGNHVLTAFGNAVSKMEEAIQMTKKNKKYPDPGAHAVGIWIRAVFEGVKLRWPLDVICLQ